MTGTFDLDRGARELYDASGRRFDAATRTWTFVRSAEKAANCEAVDIGGAVAWLNRESGHPLRVPVGVIGPREASAAQLRAALRVGELLADRGLMVICGGRQGVMQAVSEGVARVGGLSIGLLPGPDTAEANHFVSVAIATGIGEARNALIARAAFAIICIGDSYGTLSEVALGRQFGKLVVGLEGAARVDGVVHAATPEEAVDLIAEAVLAV
ncbi:MAG: TIGR00725 family protein [Burkholderiales bacterium]